MKISFVKVLNEKLPYWMKRPFSHLIRGRLVNNKVFLKQYEQLKKADTLNKTELEQMQLEKLRQVLDHAYCQTVYYRELFERIGFNPKSVTTLNDLKKLPVLTKKMIFENFENLKGCDINDFYEVRTSGTTGAPTHVLMERNAIYREWAFIYHYWAKYGYEFRTSKLATLRGVDLHGKLCEINPLYQEIRLNIFQLNRKNIKEYVRLTDNYGADFIYGYPSAVYNFCRLAKEAKLKLEYRFKAVFLISENLYDFQEAEIQEVLCCPIAMFYGHTERAVYAERYDDGYIFHPLYGVTEISKNNTPIVTGFINSKMPLIRYEMDDSVEYTEDGKAYIVGHRNSEVVYGANGEQFRVSALNFHGAISSQFPWFQFVQEIPGVLILKLPIGYASHEELNKLCSNIDRHLNGAVKVNIELVDSATECTMGYKYRLLIQKVQYF